MGGMERGARKATEASSRTPSEGPGAVPAAGEVDRAGMYAEAPESRSAAGRRRLWKMIFMTGNRLMCYASKGDQDSRFIGNLCGSQAWVKAKAIDYLQDRQNIPIIQNLSMHRLGRRPRKASDLLAVPRYRHEEDRTVIAPAHPDPLHLPRRSGQDCQGAVEGALESPSQPTLIHRAMTGSYILAP